MDFFEHQDAARRKTGRLVLLFAAAVAAIIVSIYVVAVLLFGSAQQYQAAQHGASAGFPLWRPEVLLVVAPAVLVVVGGGSLYKVSQLSGGGHVVALTLGGRQLAGQTADLHERKLLNVVEEMSIASGVPVPPVYVMDDEEGINAFAAGFSPSDAVIAVTRGTIEKLSRDELQGVIAHEFSHILNGDMRLNIRLIGVLHGILLIGLIGYGVLRSLRYQRVGSSRGKGGGGAILAIIAMGLALLVIGYVGVFFGNLIKAAVSRQREYLADASAVQFTRNPDGIAGALKRIGASVSGSRIAHPAAEQASHMFFGQAMHYAMMNSLFATHPPLRDRIRRIDPSWDGSYEDVKPVRRPEPEAKKKKKPRRAGMPWPLEAATGAAVIAAAADTSLADRIRAARQAGAAASEPGQRTDQAVAQIGRPTPEHLAYAASLIESIPEPLKSAAREPYGARAVIFALLLDDDADVRRRQLDRLREHSDAGLWSATEKLRESVQKLNPNARLPLLELTLPALREMSPKQFEMFRENVKALIAADQMLSLFELMLSRLLQRHLMPTFSDARPKPVRHATLAPASSACSKLLSVLAKIGADSTDAAAQAFLAASQHLGVEVHFDPDSSLIDLSKALDELASVAPQGKRRLLLACGAAITADRRITVREAELLRAVADSLDCPMPPLLPGQPIV